jgi:hypothetical protein
MFEYDTYSTNSIIITQYINTTYQHKNTCLLLTDDLLSITFDTTSIGIVSNLFVLGIA